MIKKLHRSVWTIIAGFILILAGLLFVPADIDYVSVPLRVAGNVILGSGIVWSIVHFGRTK